MSILTPSDYSELFNKKEEKCETQYEQNFHSKEKMDKIIYIDYYPFSPLYPMVSVYSRDFEINHCDTPDRIGTQTSFETHTLEYTEQQRLLTTITDCVRKLAKIQQKIWDKEKEGDMNECKNN